MRLVRVSYIISPLAVFAFRIVREDTSPLGIRMPLFTPLISRLALGCGVIVFTPILCCASMRMVIISKADKRIYFFMSIVLENIMHQKSQVIRVVSITQSGKEANP